MRLLSLLILLCIVAPPRADVPAQPVPLKINGVDNAFQVGPKIICGAVPRGAASFKALAARGIKTILSVDGAPPDVATAQQFGLRTVHIPVEYSGVERTAALKIARAVRDLPGPVFIHCHHGKHRGPAAAALAAMSVEKWNHAQALALLKQAGTSPHYAGLWHDVRDFKAPTKHELDAVPARFPAVAPVPPMAAAMVQIDARWEHLRQIQKAGWKAPATHPDLDPPHEALLLREAWRELARAARKTRPSASQMDFQRHLHEAEGAAVQLEAALRKSDASRANDALTRIGAGCASCHAAHRDRRR